MFFFAPAVWSSGTDTSSVSACTNKENDTVCCRLRHWGGRAGGGHCTAAAVAWDKAFSWEHGPPLAASSGQESRCTHSHLFPQSLGWCLVFVTHSQVGVHSQALFTHAYMYAHIIHTHTHACTHRLHMHACMHTHTHTHNYVDIHVLIHACAHQCACRDTFRFRGLDC